MSCAHASAVRTVPQPVIAGLAENPKPGKDGQTTWNASSAEPPWSVGSVSGPITFWNSVNEPGQPWVMTNGSAFTCGERTWRKWMSSPSISARNCGKPLKKAARAGHS